MAKSRPFIINEMLRLKKLYMVDYLRNSRGFQSEQIITKVMILALSMHSYPCAFKVGLLPFMGLPVKVYEKMIPTSCLMLQ